MKVLVLRYVIAQNDVFYPVMELLNSNGIWEFVLPTMYIVNQEYM